MRHIIAKREFYAESHIVCHFGNIFAEMNHILAAPAGPKSSVSAGRRPTRRSALRHKRAASPFCRDIVATSLESELAPSG
jgi:hypothetical protein